MVQLKILSGKKSGSNWTASHLPISIGRDSSADLSLDEPGVWDRHCEIHFTPEGFLLKAKPDHPVIINGQTKQETALRNGDIIEMGALKVSFGLGPVQQRSLLPREIVTWVALAALCFVQIALIYRLIR